ncbi:hypothetical protein ACS0TY_017261 [Phlomoides rotata]
MDKEAMIMKEIQESTMRKSQQQRPIGSAMSEWLMTRENLKKEMENLQNLQREKESDEDEEQEQEEDPSEEEDEEVELNDEELEFIEALDEFLEEFKEFDSMEHKDQETNENSFASFSSLIMIPLEAKEEDKHCLIEDKEQKEDGQRNWKNEDDSLIIKRDQGECPLMDMSNNEQENQEASKDTLKSEMGISILLNSSIYYFLDNNVSIDFILPLDNFDEKKEVKENLGILEQKGGGWKEMLRSFIEEKLCTKCMDDRATFHWRLVEEEAQRLRYNGKEDRYPWPFR